MFRTPRSHLILLLATAPLAAMPAAQASAQPAGFQPAGVEAAESFGPAVQRRSPARGVYEIVYSPRRNAVFVATSGGWGEGADPARILRLNADTLAVEGEILLERKAFGLALDDAGDRLYVGNTVDASLTVVDLATERQIAVIQLEQKTAGKDGELAYPRDLRQLVVDPANERVYIAAHAFEAGSVLHVVNTRTLRVEKTLTGLGETKVPGIWLDAPSHRLFLSNLLGEILTVDTRTLEIANRFDSGVEQPMNMVLDPATNRLFVTDQGSQTLRDYLASISALPKIAPGGDRVAVIDAATGAAVASIPTEEGPLQLLFDSERDRLYVTNRAAGTVTAYDSETYVPLGSVSVPDHPNTLALDRQRNILFASVKNGEAAEETQPETVVRMDVSAR